jgi:hypothetical protein
VRIGLGVSPFSFSSSPLIAGPALFRARQPLIVGSFARGTGKPPGASVFYDPYVRL